MHDEWSHPGGKLIEKGPGALSESELLAVIISTGIKGKPAQKIADEIVEKYGSLVNLSNRPLEELLQIKGLSDVKITRIAAAMELGLRLTRKRGGAAR